MTKLALCFSGDTRTYNICFESIKTNLLDRFDCDVFISTYETSDEIKNNIINLYNPKKIIFHNKNDITKIVSDYSNSLVNIKLNPISVFNEQKVCKVINSNNPEDYFFNYDKYEKRFIYGKFSYNALCQFFGIYDVSKLCKEYMLNHDINYDYILRIRFDDKFYSEFVLNELQENEILINLIQHYSDSIKLQDHFFMCKSETFFKIASIYDNLNKIIETINNNKCWLPTSGYQETLLLIQTILHNVKIKGAQFFCGKLP
jgi:hypothetical protein